jgi:zinc protease
VSAITRADVQAWYEASVVPEGAIITVVGDVDPQQVRSAIEQRFGGWSGTLGDHNARLAQGGNYVGGGQVVDVNLVDKSNVTLLWVGPGPSRAGTEWPRYSIASYILGGDFGARLNKRLRVAEGLTYGSYSWIDSSLAPGTFNANAEVNPGNIPAATTSMTEELAKYFASGPTPEELATAKSFLTGNFPVRLSTNSAVANTLTEAIYLNRGVDYIQQYPALVNAVTMEQVNAAIKQYIDPSKLVHVRAGTLSE